jgi:hypothetical protein
MKTNTATEKPTSKLRKREYYHNGDLVTLNRQGPIKKLTFGKIYEIVEEPLCYGVNNPPRRICLIADNGKRVTFLAAYFRRASV